MRKIQYPTNATAFKQLTDDYISRFGTAVESFTKAGKMSKRCKEYRWKKFKKAKGIELDYPKSVKEILIAPYTELAKFYETFISQSYTKKEMGELESIFNYDGYDGAIASFFIDHSDELQLHSCFYCETAYVNAYSVAGKSKKYFDVDHVLPKSKCPILALSLFNFVPACQVCNSRIKKAEPIGRNAKERKELSPTSEDYKFEQNVTFRLRPLHKGVRNFMANPSLFMIKVNAISPYDQEVSFFQLEERYEYHKMEALRLRDLKARYPRTHTRNIAKLLGRSISDVEEDIFHKKFLTKHDRCFRKFTLDILK